MTSKFITFRINTIKSTCDLKILKNTWDKYRISHQAQGNIWETFLDAPLDLISTYPGEILKV
jgi:hypothetical protein